MVRDPFWKLICEQKHNLRTHIIAIFQGRARLNTGWQNFNAGSGVPLTLRHASCWTALDSIMFNSPAPIKYGVKKCILDEMPKMHFFLRVGIKH
jgi:hypothetical protein